MAVNTVHKLAIVAIDEESIWLPIDKVDPGFVGKRLQAVQFKTVPSGVDDFLALCQKL